MDMGQAYILKDKCHNHTDGIMCMTCYDRCPLRGEAMILSGGFIPAPTTACVGCGVCQYVCPIDAVVVVPSSVKVMPAALPLAALVLELLTGKRLWCRYVCPQSVLLGLSARFFPRAGKGLRIDWQAKRCSCGKDAPCRAACSLGLNPRNVEGPERRDCTMCGDCVKACASKGGALCLKFDKK